MVAKVDVTMKVGKESKEVIDAVTELIKDIRAGKDVALIATENLTGLVQAVEGYDKLDDEFKSDVRNETVGYAAIQMAEALAPDDQPAE